MKTIVCYGDSNTWGFDPSGHDEEAGTDKRFPYDVRWTGVLQKELGPEYLVCEEGMNARTTAFDDPISPYRNGLSYLAPCLLTKMPVDLLVIMLGTNDVKIHLGQTPFSIAKGLDQLIATAQNPMFGREGATPEILILAPIDIDQKIPTRWTGNYYNEESGARVRALREHYQTIAKRRGCRYLDASQYAQPHEDDYLHMSAEGHGCLGRAVAQEVRNIL